MNVKRAPPAGRFAAKMLPPCASTIARLIARPRPTPGVADSRAPRVNFSKIASSWPVGMPGPSSLHASRRARRRAASARDGHERCRPACTWRRSRAGCRARARSASRRTRPAAGRAAASTSTRCSRERRSRRAAARCRPPPRSAAIARRSLHLAALDARHVEQVVDERAHAPRLVGDRVRRSRAAAADSGGRVSASDSASPTSAASGVRRSCDSADEQRVAQPLRLHVHQRLLRDLDVVHALERDGGERGEGVELPALLGHEQQARVVAAGSRARRACASARAAAGTASRCRRACRCPRRPAAPCRRPTARRRCRPRVAGARRGATRRRSCASGTSIATSARNVLPMNSASRPRRRPRSAAGSTCRARIRRACARAPRDATRRAPGSAARRSAGPMISATASITAKVSRYWKSRHREREARRHEEEVERGHADERGEHGGAASPLHARRSTTVSRNSITMLARSKYACSDVGDGRGARRRRANAHA